MLPFMKKNISIIYATIAFAFLLIFFSFSLFKSNNSSASNSTMIQEDSKRSMVVLTYDDALDVHLDHVIPLLDSMNIKATFYLNTGAISLSERRQEWKTASYNGHELGNHTIHHPCIGESLNREWVSAENDLDNYTLEKLMNEINEANDTLQAIDGRNRRTYAYTCGDTMANHRSYVSELKSIFPSARGVRRNNNRIDSLDLYQLNAFSIADHTAKEAIEAIEKNHQEEGLLVFLFHGVGGGHGLNMDINEHRLLINYLNSHKDRFSIVSMLEATDFVIWNPK